MPAALFVPFRADQHVGSEGREEMAAYRTAVGGRLGVRRWTHRPPARRGQLRHLPIVPRSAVALTRTGLGLGIGVGVGVGLALAMGSARRRTSRDDRTDEDDGRLRGSSPPGADARLGADGRLATDGALLDGPTARRAAMPGGGKAAATGARASRASAVHELLLGQIDAATEALEGADEEDLERAVHEARKAIKRARSMLRLLRAELPAKRRRRANALLREAGRALTESREADVALATLEGVIARGRKRIRRSSGVARLRERLAQERLAARARLPSAPRERALTKLSRARAKLSALGVGSHADGLLDASLARSYSRGRRAMRAAAKKRTVASMHEWRKRAKDLRYGAEALEGLTRKERRLHALAQRADALGETLGEEHDLALLRERVERERKLFRGDARARRALLRQIERDRERLQEEALKDGRRLYGAKRREFAKRLRAQLG